MATAINHITNPQFPLDPHSPDWHVERRKGLGGSDIGAAIGVDGTCKLQLWFDKRGTPQDFPEPPTAFMQRGVFFEETVHRLYELKSGRKVVHQATKVSEQHPWARVNIDGRINTLESPEHEWQIGPGVLEIKTRNEWMYRKTLAEGMSEREILQVQHGMFITGWKWASFAVAWLDGLEMIWFDVRRDEKIIALIAQQGEAFWGLVEFGPQPEPLPFGSKPCRSCAWRKTCPNWKGLELPKEFRESKYETDDSLAELANDYKQAEAICEQFEATREQIKTKLQEAIGERGAVDIPAAGLKIIWREQDGRKMVDSKALESKFPEVYSQVVKRSAPSRPFKTFHY